MISRRQIRVKVMQTLYTLAAAEDELGNTGMNAEKVLTDKLERTLDLFTLAVLYVVRVAQYAEINAAQRSGKYLPTDEDRNVSTRIAADDFVLAVLANESFNARVKDRALAGMVNDEQVRKWYQQLIRTDDYRRYAYSKDGGPGKAIVAYIWKEILNKEAGLEFWRDEVSGWEEDEPIIQMLMENYFRDSRVNFLRILPTQDKREYAYDLLKTTLEKEGHLMSLISPKLENWDAERVAMIDLLLLRMGVAELLYFPTIPTKVTINEYIDIAKQYSTPQSGQFVNGILDSLLKDFVKEGTVNKPERFIKNSPSQ